LRRPGSFAKEITLIWKVLPALADPARVLIAVDPLYPSVLPERWRNPQKEKAYPQKEEADPEQTNRQASNRPHETASAC